ncbi:DUF2180 family protein [Streptomyces sp. NBC_00696]|uniref:DUF2180 family protein n=1 Tax=Streptomyces sp. NBC_00696 TaxID=2903672 RepID=UPI002E2FF4E4|nr:DUF2180 family protein [Streptomyces sp. NBC_00696]
MHCLDCAGIQMSTPASGVCSQCGAAVCAEHAVVSRQSLTCTRPVYRQVVVTPSARRVLCTTCAAAHAAYAACCPVGVPAGS